MSRAATERRRSAQVAILRPNKDATALRKSEVG
jgi:hypothetical protein